MGFTESLQLSGSLRAGGLTIGNSPSLLLDSKYGNLENQHLVNFTRSTIKRYFGSDGLLKEAAIDTLPVSYDPADNSRLGWLIEESRTNLLLYSIDFSAVEWNKTSVTIVENSTTSPDGTNNATKLVENSSDSFHFVGDVLTLGANPYSFSVFLKAAERTTASLFLSQSGNFGGSFDLANGTATASGAGSSVKIKDVGDGWFRCTVINDGSADLVDEVRIGIQDGAISSYVGDGSSGIYIWGAQLEQASFPTSPIITAGSTVTRSADVADITDLGWFNPDEGTVICEFEYNNYPSDILSFDGKIELRALSSNEVQYVIFSGTTKAISWSNSSSGQKLKAGFSYKDNDSVLAGNGNIIGSFQNIVPTGITNLGVGSNPNGSKYIDGFIKQLKYYPRQLSDNQHQSLTT